MVENKIAIFRGQKIRRLWNEQQEKWYFSVIDVIAALSGSKNPGTYWRVLKSRLKNEGSQVVTKCNTLKMIAPDGKYYLTDAADTEVMLRIIQSIPSPNAEPLKLWLARVGYERLEETADPELAMKYKRFKGLKKENLRDNMTNLELVLNMLAETATTEISHKRKPKSFPQNKRVAREGGTVAGNARREIEAKTGKKVITRKNAKSLKLIKGVK